MTGVELRDKRKALGLSQQELALKVGVGRKTILKLEKTEIIDPSKSTLLDNYFKTSKNEDEYIKGLDQFSIDQIAVYLINNQEAFMNSKTYQLFKKDIIIKEATLLADKHVEIALERIKEESKDS